MTPKWTVSPYTFTQPYHTINFEYVPQDLAVAQELKRLEEIDQQVAAMTEFPLVQELMERITRD